MNQKFKNVIRLLIFVISLILIVHFHNENGNSALMMMMLGLTGLLWVLWRYNTDFTKKRMSMLFDEDYD